MSTEENYNIKDEDLDENIESDSPGLFSGGKETKLKRGLDIFGNLFMLNILFVLTSAPIITIGASFTALYAMMFKIQRRDDYTVVKEYFREFKLNFKRATLAWLLLIIACVMVGAQYVYVSLYDSNLVTFYMIFLAIEVILLLLVIPFLFPLFAYYDNTVLNTFKNSFLLAISNLGAWLKIFVVWFAVIAFSFGYEIIFLNTWYLWLLLMFALLAYVSSITAKRVFDRVNVVKQEAKDKPKETEEEKKARKAKEKQKKLDKKNHVKKSMSMAEKQAHIDALNQQDTKENSVDEQASVSHSVESEKTLKEQQQNSSSEQQDSKINNNNKKKNNKKTGNENKNNNKNSNSKKNNDKTNKSKKNNGKANSNKSNNKNKTNNK